VLYAVFQQSAEPQAGLLAVDQYKLAREAWSAAARAAAVYRNDVSYGSTAMRRGHWSDRLAAIDKDFAALTEQVQAAPATAETSQNTRRAIVAATERPARPDIECVHAPPANFEPGAPLTLAISVPQQAIEPAIAAIFLHYRHVDQAERWQRVEMQASGVNFSAAIPGAYTQSKFALQYRFEVRAKSGAAWLVPGFNATLSSQPYYALMRSGA
jgi:hypothetical protein